MVRSPLTPGLLAVVLALGLAGCGLHSPFGESEDPRSAAANLVFSPNGEPLAGGALGRATCEEAQARWFARVDSNRDGAIDRGEFLADAGVQFARMDLDRDGFITAAELSTFRMPYLQTDAGKPSRSAKAEGQSDEGRRSRPSRRGAHALPADVPDPVMSADTNLDFQVSRQEFDTLAGQTFAKLDTDHDGRLTLPEVQAACQRNP